MHHRTPLAPSHLDSPSNLSQSVPFRNKTQSGWPKVSREPIVTPSRALQNWMIIQGWYANMRVTSIYHVAERWSGDMKITNNCSLSPTRGGMRRSDGRCKEGPGHMSKCNCSMEIYPLPRGKNCFSDTHEGTRWAPQNWSK